MQKCGHPHQVGRCFDLADREKSVAPVAHQMVVANIAESRGQKNDRREAFGLAEKLRTGALDRRVFKDLA